MTTITATSALAAFDRLNSIARKVKRATDVSQSAADSWRRLNAVTRAAAAWDVLDEAAQGVINPRQEIG